ncbi:hypothetical protein KAX17_03415 [Candidatus Bipolaricaulota bacterium]|nr:hypothetical protein [Candidatus Bipolaricaulota bacterium]
MSSTTEWPQLEPFLGNGSLAKLVGRTTLSSFGRRALTYLDGAVAELAPVHGFTPARLARLVEYGLSDPEAFLDHRAELEILRQLAAEFAGDLEWGPQTEQGIRPDIRLQQADYAVYIEVSRVQRTRAELELEEFVAQQEVILSKGSSPFGVLLFLDLSGINEGVDITAIMSSAVGQALDGIASIRRDQDLLREIERTWRANRDRADSRAIVEHQDHADLAAILAELFDKAVERDPVSRELQLDLRDGASGTASLFWRGAEAPRCMIQCFGRLPDHSDRIWQKMAEEVRQLPRGEAGLLCLWVDCDANLIDLYSPEFWSVRESSGEFRTVWRTSLQSLFSSNRDRLSGVIFHSGFERELALNPLASVKVERGLAEKLKELLDLRRRGYLLIDD